MAKEKRKFCRKNKLSLFKIDTKAETEIVKNDFINSQRQLTNKAAVIRGRKQTKYKADKDSLHLMRWRGRCDYSRS